MSNHKSPTFILLIVNALVMLALLGFFVYTKLVFKRPPILEGQEIKTQKHQAHRKDEKEIPTLLKLEDIRVNLSPDSQKSHAAVLGITIECRSEEASKTLESRMAAITDKLIALLNKTTYDDLITVQGRLFLKERMIQTLNQIVGDELVTDLYFTQYLVQ